VELAWAAWPLDAAWISPPAVAPKAAPRGERRVGSRPHFRFIDTAAFYGKQPADNLTSSLL
jgi:hypothetical protein